MKTKRIFKKIFIAVDYYFKAISILKNNPDLFRYILYSWSVTLIVFFAAFIIYVSACLSNIIKWAKTLSVPEKFNQAVIQASNKILAALNKIAVKKIEIDQALIEEHAITAWLCVFGAVIAFLIALAIQDFLRTNITNKMTYEIERIITGKVLKAKKNKEKRTFWGYIKLIFQVIKKFIKKAILFLLTIIAVIILYNIPVLGKIVSFFSAGYCTGLFYLNSVFERRKTKQKRKKRKILKNFWLVITFGWISLGVVLIPFINVIFMPLNIIAGTIIAVEKVDRRKQSFTKSSAKVKRKRTAKH